MSTNEVFLMFVFIGATSFVLNSYRISYISSLCQKASKIEGIITDVDEKDGYLRNKLTIEVKKINSWKQIKPWRKYKAVVFCRCHWLKVGDVVTITDPKMASPPKASPFRNKTSWQNYLLKEGILGYIFCEKRGQIKKIRTINNISSFFTKLKNDINQRLKNKLTESTYNLFASIFLGIKKIEAGSWLRESFAHWGLSHYLARSGLHVALYSSLWLSFLAALAVPHFFRYLLIFFLLILYASLSWTSISFVRAQWVFLLLALGRIFNNQIKIPHLLSLVALTILLISPFQLFALDFQLSFVLAFTLSVITTKLITSDE
ncbi:ComEC/Rec2 family competence protein [Candidatus Dependentiae bacterium]